MDMPKNQTVFAARIRAIEPTEETKNEVKASLGQLRALLPANINPEDEPALLFVAGNLAVAGMVNLNDDGLDKETALAVYPKFARQQINLEHNRKSVVGYIVHAGLSELETDRIISDEEARMSSEPFNIAIVFALWRAVNPELCNYIEAASRPEHPDFDSLSLSFEMGFDNYRVIGLPVGNPKIADAMTIVRPDDKEFSRLSGALRAYKGSGFHPDDKNIRLYRVIDEGVVPLGGGIVTVPAAAVKGLVAITETPVENVVFEEPEEDRESEMEHEEHEMEEIQIDSKSKEALMEFLSASTEKLLNLQNCSKNSVSNIISSNLINMKPADIQALKDRASQATKVEELNEVVASATGIIDAIVAESERQEEARKQAESHAAEIEKARNEAQAAAQALTEQVTALRQELDVIKQAQAAAAAEQMFNERMTAIDETFELNDDERNEIVSDIRSLDAEAFAKWMEKAKKLMKEKTKEYKKQMSEEAKASKLAALEQLVASLNEKGVKSKLTEAGVEIEEVIASAINNPSSTPAGSVVQPNQNDLNSLAAKAFAGLQIGGKNVVESKK